MTRTCLTWSFAKYGLANISGLCSPMPITGRGSVGFGSLLGPEGFAGAGTAKASESSAASARARPMRLRLHEDGVLVRVGGRAAAEQHERLRAGVDELVVRARRDHHGVAGADAGLVLAQSHAAHALREQVDLLGDAVV